MACREGARSRPFIKESRCKAWRSDSSSGGFWELGGGHDADMAGTAPAEWRRGCGCQREPWNFERVRKDSGRAADRQNRGGDRFDQALMGPGRTERRIVELCAQVDAQVVGF